MKDFIFRNDDGSFRVKYKTSLTKYNDNEASFTLMDIQDLSDFEVEWAKMPYQEKVATIGDLMNNASNQNLRLDEVDDDGTDTLVNIGTALAITTSSLSGGSTSSSYTDTVVAEGGSGERVNGSKPNDYTFSVESGNLPDGLSLNSDTGDITGTPTSAGTYTFTIGVTDLYSQTVTKQFSITVS